MKIVVLTGSPHKNGASGLLAERFIQGAAEAGHETYRFDAAFQTVGVCRGCDYCRKNGSVCIQKDGMDELRPKLLEADLVAFVTPLYYHDMTAQLKTVLDRFYAIDKELRGRKRQTVLLVTAFESHEQVMRPVKTHYDITMQYLNWDIRGQIFALDCGTREDAEKSVYPEAAYQLGREL